MFSQFNWKEDCVGEFLGLFLHENESYIGLWDVCKVVCVLFHGQSAVERGFRVIKGLLVENLSHQSLVVKRVVNYCFTSLNAKLYEYQIPVDLLKSYKLAYSQYKA